eukprot:jgi/Pico_ML_1/51843/g353.t1
MTSSAASLVDDGLSHAIVSNLGHQPGIHAELGGSCAIVRRAWHFAKVRIVGDMRQE